MVDVVTRTHRDVVAHFRPDAGIGLALVPRGGSLDPANEVTLQSAATTAGGTAVTTSSLLHLEWSEFVAWLARLGYTFAEDEDQVPLLEQGLSFDGEAYALTANDTSNLPTCLEQLIEAIASLRDHVGLGRVNTD